MTASIHPAFQTHLLNDKGIEKAKAIAAAFDDLLHELMTKHTAGPSREMSLVTTKLEEACFFAKKAMASEAQNQGGWKPVEQRAKEMFEAYNAQGPNPWKTWNGGDVPSWDECGEQVQAKWIAAASVR